MLATGSFDASVGIWRRYDTDDLNPKPMIAPVDFDARDENIDEYDEDEWRFAIVLDGHESEVKSVAWSTAGNLLATCSRDKSVWIWEEVGDDDYETIAVLQEHEGDVKCVAWHPDEELLASASYDDDIRLWREDVDDWGCVGVLRGHDSTVWSVQWETLNPNIYGEAEKQEAKEKWMKRREASGPRLLSCSDDLSIRVWRRNPKEKIPQSRLSIIRSGSSEEDWIEEARLPVVHSRPIYSVAWSKSGRIVSTGGDGSIVVYEERWRHSGNNAETTIPGAQDDSIDEVENNGEPKANDAEPMEDRTGTDVVAEDAKGHAAPISESDPGPHATDWVIVAQMEGAHGVFEVNHVAWAPRKVKAGGSIPEQEDLIITTGDDGVVKVWRFDI